jgi:ribose transport system substrate-binding protein
MKNKLKLLSLFSLIVLMLFAAACGKTQETNSGTESSKESTKTKDDGKIKIGVVLKSLNNDYWKFVEAGAKEAAEKYGVEVEVLGPPAETNFEEQIRMMEDQITKGVDALVVAPSQPKAAIPTFNKAKEAGIPVILIDTDADFGDKVSFIGTENYEAGKLAGKYIADLLNNGDKVAIIRGAMGDNTHNQRTDGAKEIFDSKGIQSIVQPADSDRAKAVSVTENILTSNPDVKVVYATSDEMALGALKAVKSAGKTDQIKVIGFDGSPEGLQSILDGGLTASIAQKPYMIGFTGVEAGLKVAKGESVEKRIDTGADVITKDNAKELLDQYKGILKK